MSHLSQFHSARFRRHKLSAYRRCAIALLGLCLSVDISARDEPSGPVGWWSFDDGTGKDLTGNGNDAVVAPEQIYSLGDDRACVRFGPGQNPLRVPASEDSPLAIRRGTISFWLNASGKYRTLLEYDNGAVQLNNYRGCFQVRFGGQDDFRYWGLALDDEWPQYDMREWAFYPHIKASIGDAEWHLFSVAYDDREKRITGWRDGEVIAVVDLSTVGPEPLARQGLTEIVTGDGLIGYLDDLRIYDRVLADAEIRQIYEATKKVYANRQDPSPVHKPMEIYKYREEDRALYRAWLQYAPPAKTLGTSLLGRVVAEGSNSTVQTAASELASAVQSMLALQPLQARQPSSGPSTILGTSATSSWIREHEKALGLDRLQGDGFILRTLGDGDDRRLVVAGRIPAGVTFGTFDLIRRLQLGQDLAQLDVLENPKIPLRMVDHWSYFRGLPGDAWRGGGRDRSIYSWEELRTGDTKLIRDWVRMLASAGWNAICPSEVNWHYRNNFLEHLDEVEILAGILRDYGMKLYWSPSYLLALEQETADRLYARVPDFGGYMMKLGSEKQNGDPRPAMVNRIADTLRRYGGKTLVRGFVYGNFRYTREPYRNLIPHDLFAGEDGNFRDNVIIIPKGSPLDWDFSAPIPALDGAIRKNLSGSEQVIDKKFVSSWVEKWKWWLEQDHYHHGPGSLNKFDVDCIMGVSMISPSPAWTASPLNMVNYYGLGRLAWNPDRSVDEIYSEWITQTFGADPIVLAAVKTILFLSDDVTRKLYNYRGYRGMWIDTGDDEDLIQDKTTHIITEAGMGPRSEALAERTLAQYSPGLREVYGDRVRAEEFLTSFHFVPHNHRLSIGRTLIQDFYENMNEAVVIAEQLPALWEQMQGRVDDRRFTFTLENLEDFVESAKGERVDTWKVFGKVTETDGAEVTAALTPDELAKIGVYNVRHFGAKGDTTSNDGEAIQKAIDTCYQADGGTVFVPTGIYLTSGIQLRSQVTLALDKGAVLTPPENLYGTRALIRGKGLEQARIYGPGTILGGGLSLVHTTKVTVLNLRIRDAGDFAVHATSCKDLIIDNVTIKTPRNGLFLADCDDVEVAQCRIEAVQYADGRAIRGGDAITLQNSPGKERGGRIVFSDSFLAADRAIHWASSSKAALPGLCLENLTMLRLPRTR